MTFDFCRYCDHHRSYWHGFEADKCITSRCYWAQKDIEEVKEKECYFCQSKQAESFIWELAAESNRHDKLEPMTLEEAKYNLKQYISDGIEVPEILVNNPAWFQEKWNEEVHNYGI